MNPLPSPMLRRAQTQALYCMFLYLSQKLPMKEGGSILNLLEGRTDQNLLSQKELARYHILLNAAQKSPSFGESVVLRLISSTGLNAAVFSCGEKRKDCDISVAFSGTASGEWLDNGDGLSGIPRQNIYYSYESSTSFPKPFIASQDFATDSQVEALNFFNKICAEFLPDNYSKKNIIVSGHSKGGNKAQFVGIHSPAVKEVFSFNGQGFSPEAIKMFEKRFGEQFETRRSKLFGFCTDNDFVNVLGVPLIPERNMFYFESSGGFHGIDAFLDKDGRFNMHCERGVISEFVQGVSQKLMALDVSVRKRATLGVMNVFHKLFDTDSSDDLQNVSLSQTVSGINIALSLVAQSIVRG